MVRKKFSFPEDESFVIPEPVAAHMHAISDKGEQSQAEWTTLWEAYSQAHPDLASQINDLINNRLPDSWQTLLPEFNPEEQLATRQALNKILHALIGKIPFLAGGSADLAPSNGTAVKNAEDFNPDNYGGTNFHFGVREHAMGAIINGMALSGMLKPYGATFLVFADYMKPALRLAALMQIPSTFIFTHDSIAVGEDGPTHQPIEQLVMLRSIPGMTVIRPADANETKAAWKYIMTAQTPVSLILSRQALPILDSSLYPSEEGTARGGYILADWGNASGSGSKPVILIATGAEVHLAVQAQQQLEEEGIPARVISMPSVELFLHQPEEYREEVLPTSIRRRVVIEAASTIGWHRFITEEGTIVGIDRFGSSAPGSKVLKEYGFTAEHIVATVKNLL